MHTLCHSFATSLVEGGHDRPAILELRGDHDVSTGKIATRELNRGGLGVRGPPDAVFGPQPR